MGKARHASSLGEGSASVVIGSVQPTGLVRLLQADPDLARWVDPRMSAAVTRRLVVESAEVPRGPWPALAEPSTPMLGLLLLDGLALRTVALGRKRGVELLGAGDLVRPWEQGGGDASVRSVERWTVIEPLRLAILDHEFEADAARVPGLLAELCSRAARRSRSLAVHRAAAQVPQLAARVELLLWSIADRWGRVAPGGVVTGIRLSHETLAELVGARRPSVSTALSDLIRTGRIARTDAGQWLLRREPPVAGDGATAGLGEPVLASELAELVPSGGLAAELGGAGVASAS
jgi:CRP/FNR family transcriptional regulator, cyclic AMP receptor protein